MFVITGIAGCVGGVVAQELLAANLQVRAVLRDPRKAVYWRNLGCDIAFADMNDGAALSAAFKCATAVFVLPPSEFDPEPGFPEAKEVINAVVSALKDAAPEKVVCISTIGAQSTRENLLTQRKLMEQALSQLAQHDIAVALLRPGWFMENAAWDVGPARDQHVISSFLQPLDKAVPMVATADVGRTAAALLQENWNGVRIVELEGQRVSPEQIAATFARILGHPVALEVVPVETWDPLFRSQGMKNPLPRIRMLQGFNEGWICFEGAESTILKGSVKLENVLRQLIKAAAAAEG